MGWPFREEWDLDVPWSLDCDVSRTLRVGKRIETQDSSAMVKVDFANEVAYSRSGLE